MLVLFVTLATLSFAGIVFNVSDSISNRIARRALKRRVYSMFL